MENKEELFKEACLRYPIGTKFRVVHKPEIICTVLSHDKHDSTFMHSDRINLIIQEQKSNCISGSVHYQNRWAEIISLPHPTNYELWK